jgi:hypothetical protein
MAVNWSHNGDGIKKADITVEKSNKHTEGNISCLLVV